MSQEEAIAALPFHEILDKVPSAIYVCNTEGQVLYSNKVLCDFIGVSKEDLVNLDWMQFVGPEIENIRHDWLQEVQKNPYHDHESIFTIKRHDGVFRMCLSRSAPLVPKNNDNKGKKDKVLYVGCATDIDDQYREKEKQEVEKEMIKTIFEQLPVGIYVIDSDFHPVIFNRKLRELWLDKMETQNTSQNMMEWAVNRIKLPYEEWPIVQTIKTGKVIEDFLMQTEDSRIIINTCPIYDHNHNIKYGIAVVQDVTKQFLMESERELSRLKTEFIMNMSHEIRTPLHGILGMTDIISTEISNEKQLEDITHIKNAATTLLTIVNDILDISKMETDSIALECVEFDLRQLVEDVQDLFKPAFINKNLTYSCHVQEDLPKIVKSDPNRVRQCLTNVLSNSVKFTSPGGSVSFQVYEVKGELKDIKDAMGKGNMVNYNKNNNIARICFEIQDTGIGMSKETLENVFNSFVQGDTSTTKSYSGLGLGLTITKKLISLLNNGDKNDIKVESSLGKGSTFFLYINFGLPLNDCVYEKNYEKNAGKSSERPTVDTSTKRVFSPMQNISKIPILIPSSSPNESFESRSTSLKSNFKGKQNDDAFDPKQINILLVEDNDLNRTIATRMLKKYGFTVSTAINGYDALKKIEKDDKYDVILMDIQMPVMDGYEATKELRSRGCRKPIIAQTANASENDKRMSLESGMDDYVSKPFDMSNVVEKIRYHYVQRKKT